MKKYFAIIIFIMICLLAPPLSVYATDNTLTVELKDGNGRLFDDYAVRIWCTNDWVMDIEFDEADNEANKIMVGLMLDYAEELDLIYQEKTTVNGIAQFEDLENGLYLVKIFEKIFSEENGTYTFSPFVVVLPFDTVIKPKVAWAPSILDPEPTPRPTPRPTPKPTPKPVDGVPVEFSEPYPYNIPYDVDDPYEIDIFLPRVPLASMLPQTGLKRWPVPFLFILGSLLIVLGCTLKWKNVISVTSMALGILSLIFATVFWLNNDIEESLATEYSQQRAQVLLYHINVTNELNHPVTIDYRPEVPLESEPYVVMDGRAYIGVLYIPKLNLELPVAHNLTDEILKQTPGRYFGSAADKDLVIGAHNYRTHFAGLNKLKAGDLIIFTDTNGEEITYEVTLLEVVPPTAVTEVIHSEFDITLFTCTYGGNERVVVRGKIL